MAQQIRGPLARKVVQLMKDEGPQSVNDLCEKLGISNSSSRSILVKLRQAGVIERISLGIYEVPGYDSSRSKKP